MNRPLFRGLAQTLGGTAAVAAVSLLRNVLIARAMGAAAFGLWNLCVVAMRIATESHVGALAAVAVDVPRLRGEGRDDDALALERRAMATTMLFALLAGAVSALMLRIVGGPPLATAAVLIGVSIVLQQQFVADATILRARRRFARIAAGQVIFAALYLAGLLLLLPERYLTGALLAGSGALAVATLLVRATTKRKIPGARPRHLAGMPALLRGGLGLYLVHLSFAVLLQADRVVVAAVMGSSALGHYGVLVLGGTALLFVPDAFSVVLWPFAGESYGRSSQRPAALRDLSASAVSRVGLLLIGLLPLLLAGVDVLVAVVLPYYGVALPALRLYMTGMFALGAVLPLRNVLMTVGAAGALLRVQLGVLVLIVALQTAAAAAGHGLVGVAAAGIVAWTLLLVATLVLAVRRDVLDGARALRLAVHLGVCFAVGWLLDAALTLFAAPAAEPMGAVVRLGVPAVVTLVIAAYVVRARVETDADAQRL